MRSYTAVAMTSKYGSADKMAFLGNYRYNALSMSCDDPRTHVHCNIGAVDGNSRLNVTKVVTTEVEVSTFQRPKAASIELIHLRCPNMDVGRHFPFEVCSSLAPLRGPFVPMIRVSLRTTRVLQ